MSAIIAGKCSQCQKDYYISMGHPKWFDDKVQRALDNPIYDSFETLRKRKLCPDCGKTHYAKFAADWKKHTQHLSPQSTSRTGGPNGHRSRQR